MAGYVECLVEGGRRAFVDVSIVAGVITSPGMDAWASAEPDKPLSVLFRAGEPLQIYGTSAAVLLVKLGETRQWLKQNPDRHTRVVFIDGSHEAETSPA